MIVYKIEIPIYFGELIVIINDDFKESLNKLKIRWVNQEESYNYDGLALPLEKKENHTLGYLICLKEDLSHSVIAHESLHTTNFIMKDRGIEYDYDNDEPACYLLGWIVRQCYKAYDRKK